MKPLLYESHMHTPLCKHACGEPEEYAAAAEARGLAGIIVTCHNPIPDGYSANVRMHIDEFDTYLAMVERAANTWRGRIDVRLGIESDYVPGMEAWLKELHEMADFHHVLGSVHCHIPAYRNHYLRDGWFDFQKTYFTHLAMAAETGFFDTLSHPDLVKNDAPDEWQLERLSGHIDHVLDRIAKTGVAMELNTSGLLKVIPEMNPGIKILERMHARKIPVVLGADAHHPGRVGDRFDDALRILDDVGYKTVSFFLGRQRQEVRIDDALRSLRNLEPVAG